MRKLNAQQANSLIFTYFARGRDNHNDRVQSECIFSQFAILWNGLRTNDIEKCSHQMSDMVQLSRRSLNEIAEDVPCV